MSRRPARKTSSSLSYSCARSMSGHAPMNAFDDFSCIIITSKQTVNMPVVEVKFDNDDNEVQGDTLLGGTAHHVPNRQLGIMEHRIGRDETDVGCSWYERIQRNL